MKKRLFLVSCAVTMMAGTVVLSSCSKGEEYSYSPEKAHEFIEKDYKSAFVQKYGEISPFETWDLSQRGSTLAGFAGTRGNKGQSSNIVQDMASTESYGYYLNYSNNESKIAKLFNNNWGDIVAEFGKVQPTTWAPSGKIIFSVVGVSRDDASSSKYFTWGVANTPEGDLYLRQSSPANGKNAKIGNSAEKHTSSLDFSQIPDGARWFTASSDKKKVDLSSAYNQTITDFKIVTMTIDGVSYTFWGFKCETNGGYTDLILIVQKTTEEKTLKIAKRYMVEDLGSTDDFDFNDVVVDVWNSFETIYNYELINGEKSLVNTTGPTLIKQWAIVRAAGGTIDFTIKIGNSTTWTKSQHVDPVTTMVNTGRNGAIDYQNKIIDQFDIVNKDWDSANNNIKIEVDGRGKNLGVYTITFPRKGEIPMILAVDPSVNWMHERDGVPESWIDNTQPEHKKDDYPD